jgi:hypothetical protein
MDQWLKEGPLNLILFVHVSYKNDLFYFVSSLHLLVSFVAGRFL